jgi:protein TonB
MSTNEKDRTPARAPVSDHLSVRPEGLGPAEVHFLFERREKRLGGALGASIATHGAMVLVYLLVAWLAPERVRQAMLPDLLSHELVWLADPGVGGGGGGGNKQPDPPRKVELPGKEKITVPAEKPEPKPEVKETPPEQMNIPAQTLAASIAIAPGVIESTQLSDSTGAGAGSGGGAGQGSGLGPGSGGGLGGGPYRPGNGVENPQLISQVRPQYTAEAMRAKVQGVVLLECVVQSTGAVGTCDVVRSLDSNFGLDQEALKAAKQWRFRPGTRFGEPVAVLVTIELTFTLR